MLRLLDSSRVTTLYLLLKNIKKNFNPITKLIQIQIQPKTSQHTPEKTSITHSQNWVTKLKNHTSTKNQPPQLIESNRNYSTKLINERARPKSVSNIINEKYAWSVSVQHYAMTQILSIRGQYRFRVIYPSFEFDFVLFFSFYFPKQSISISAIRKVRRPAIGVFDCFVFQTFSVSGFANVFGF